jgi:hypothetical protein
MPRAFAEFVAITVGVLVALGIDNAWAARQERLDEREYLEALVQEIEGNIEALERTLNSAAGAHANLERSRLILNAGLPPDSAGAFLTGLERATGFSPLPIVSRAVIQDLLSTGNLRLIRDRTLRHEILYWDAFLDARLTGTARAEATTGSELKSLLAHALPPNSSPLVWATDAIDEVDQAEVFDAARGVADHPRFQEELRADYVRIDQARRWTLLIQEVFREWHAALEGHVPS